MFNYYGGFFTYKKFLEGYNGQDYMGPLQIGFLIIATLTIILLCIFLRKINHKKIDIFLKVLAIVIPILEVTKICVESYFDIKYGNGFNFSGLLPLYTCSMFIYILPIAAFSKGKVKEYALAFLTTIGIFAGLTNFLMAPIMHDYPFFNYHTFTSLNFHFWMVFTGIFLISTKYYVPKWIDIIKGMVPLTIFSLIVIPIDYIYGWDYMLYHHGWGAPVLPDLANMLAGYNLRFVYTIIVFLIYFVISAIIVSIVRLICFLKNIKVTITKD